MVEENGKGYLMSMESSTVKCFGTVSKLPTEPWGKGEDAKTSHHRSVQQKLGTIYPAWKQIIKEPFKDRGGLERFEYGAV